MKLASELCFRKISHAKGDSSQKYSVRSSSIHLIGKHFWQIAGAPDKNKFEERTPVSQMTWFQPLLTH